MKHSVAISFNPSSLSIHDSFCVFCITVLNRGGGGGVLPNKRLMGMCRWMGSHFHDWIDYIGVAHFRIFGGKTVLHIYGLQTYQNVCTADEK